MNLLGMEFAPLLMPLERRLQTFGALYYASSFFFFGIGGIFLCVYLFFTSYYWLPLIYLTWFYFDRNICNEGGRVVPWTRRWNMWRHFSNYFPIKMIKTADLDPNKNYVLGYHPHGIMCAGAFCNFATEGTDFSNTYPGITPHLLTLEGQFLFPFHRDLLMATGAASATKESIEWFLTREGTGNALVLVVGGAVEALDAKPGHPYTLTINKRKGFIKLALKHGASLVPVFSFGENDLFNQVDNPVGSKLRSFQDRMTKVLGFSPPLAHGRGVFTYNMGYLPYRRPVVTIVGKPIDLDKTENPSVQQVNDVHQQYLAGLRAIFDQFKDKYGLPGQELLFT